MSGPPCLIKWSPRVKRPGQEADHSPSFSVKVKNKWIYTSTATRLYIKVLNSNQEHLAKCISNMLCQEWSLGGSVYWLSILLSMWDMTSCRLVNRYQCFRRTSVLHLFGRGARTVNCLTSHYRVRSCSQSPNRIQTVTDFGGCDSTPTREYSILIATVFCPLVSGSLS